MIEYRVKVFANRTNEWYLNGKLHREDGPSVERADGYKAWFLNGQYHREDGPAIEYADGSKAWYLNGQYHREDGPAVEYADGRKYWFLKDVEYTKKHYLQKMNQVKKMTVKEICDFLGYEIEVVKG